MSPFPDNDFATNGNGKAGQNSPNPSEKVFDSHALVKYDIFYYDPSYGMRYIDEAMFHTFALEGFGKPKPGYANKLLVRKTLPGFFGVEFVPE